QILMDGNSGDKAPSPMEMVLMAAGGAPIKLSSML
ncbi:osmotically inducible protein OsmC, partial [Shigella boydii]|nr:osmotically inducible protein OsmC [Shigella boydii]